jgi:hypothetical protein
MTIKFISAVVTTGMTSPNLHAGYVRSASSSSVAHGTGGVVLAGRPRMATLLAQLALHVAIPFSSYRYALSRQWHVKHVSG